MIIPMMKPVTKVAPPINWVYINSVLLFAMFESDVNKSGDPLPNASRVTPAKFSLRPRIFESTARTGQKLKIQVFLTVFLFLKIVFTIYQPSFRE